MTIIGRRDAAQRRVEARWGKDSEAGAEWVFDLPCPHLSDEPGDAPLGKEVLRRFKTELRAWRKAVESDPGYRPDLRNSDLRHADLSKLTLSGALLTGARMEGADLSKARMEGADLRLARMEGADLSEARIGGANLSGARMERADLSDARMEGANLRGARMERADLYDARMEGANLRLARMEGAGLSEARMEGAVLSEARMDQSTDLTEALLSGALVKSVDWRSVPISQEQVNASFGDGSVSLPKRLNRPGHWPSWDMPSSSIDAEDINFESEFSKWRDSPDTYMPPRHPTLPEPCNRPFDGWHTLLAHRSSAKPPCVESRGVSPATHRHAGSMPPA